MQSAWRFYFDIVIMILGGILGASAMIVAKKPNAKELIDKLTPHQGYIGGVMLFVGIWDLIYILTHMKLIKLLFSLPFWQIKFTFAMYIISSPVNIILGFLLGFGLISKYGLSKSEAAKEKGDAIRAKLAKFQGPLGIIAILTALGLLAGYFMMKSKLGI